MTDHSCREPLRDLTTKQHARLRVPRDWDVEPTASAEAAGLDLVAFASPGATASGFRPNVVLTSSAVGELELEQWEDGTDMVLDGSVADYWLLDRFMAADAAGAVSRRVATYRTADGVHVTALQWSRLRDGVGITATATIATEEYPLWQSQLEAIGSSFTWEDAA